MVEQHRNRMTVPDPDYTEITQDPEAPILPNRTSSLWHRYRRPRVNRAIIGPPVPSRRWPPPVPDRPPPNAPDLNLDGTLPTADGFPGVSPHDRFLRERHQDHQDRIAHHLPIAYPPLPDSSEEGTVILDLHRNEALYMPTDRLLAPRPEVTHYQHGAEVVVPIRAQNVNLLALFDTGACISIMPLRTATRLPGLAYREAALPPTVSTGGTTQTVLGTVQLQIQLGHHRINGPVTIVEDGLYDFIIGTDLQAQLGEIAIDFHTGQLSTNQSGLVPFGRRNSHSIMPIPVKIPHAEIIPARTQVLLFCRVDTIDILPNTDFVFEPTIEPLGNRGLWVGKAVVHPVNFQVPVQFLNPSTEDIRLYANSKVGHLHPLLSGMPIHFLKESPVEPEPEMPISIAQLVDLSKTTLTKEQIHELENLLIAYEDIFIKTDSDLGHCTLLQH